MTQNAASILSAALNLPKAEQLVVLEGLLTAFPAPGIWDVDDPSFVEELDRRSVDGSRRIPWDEAKRRLGPARE